VKITQIAIAASALAAGSAVAEPIYLDCTAKSPKETHIFSVALDEKTTKITHQNKDRNTFNADGFFTASEISYKNATCSSIICITHQYTIDRVTLSVTYLFRAEPVNKSLGVEAQEILSRGSCIIIKAPDRQI
jgi:hypothetical protein